MKNKSFKYLIICICLFIVYFILTNNKLINENIIFAINLWITKVFPSLFPMFILNELLIFSDLPKIISKFFNKLAHKTLKISGTSLYVFIMSIFSGTPSNAIILNKLIENNAITKEEASLTLSYTFFSSPIFLYTMLSNIFNNAITIKIIIIHYFVNVLIIILFRKKLISNNYELTINEKANTFSAILNSAIKKSLDTLLMILGTITFYIIISTIITNIFDFNITIEVIIKGLLEITQGLNNLALINISTKAKEIIAISIISFGGLSIHSQIQNIISNSNIQYKYFFIGRIFHVILSIVLILIF